MTLGISGAGREAEIEFRRVTGATPAPTQADGDAVLDCHFVEIKQASSTTLNQVRAVKYIPLAVFDSRNAQWYVVPPDAVVRLVAKKRRGQHTENPFESATLSLRSLSAFAVTLERLREATLEAIAQGQNWPDLMLVMQETRKMASELARESIKRVQDVLDAKDSKSVR